MNPADVACVVLASGLSERFGVADKLTAELCGQPVLDYVLETVDAVGFGKTFIVSQSPSKGDIVSVINNNPEIGQGHALRLGLSTAHFAGWDCVCVVLGDMPLVQVSHLRGMIDKIGTCESVVSVSGGQSMPPAVFRRGALSAVLEDKSSLGARNLFHQLNPATIPISEEETLDVDTPEDLAKVECILKARKI